MIEACENQGIPLAYLCKYFGIVRSAYYKWLRRNQGLRFTRKAEICRQIKNVFENSKGTYGSPRVWEELKEMNISVSENTVAKYMKELGLDGRHKKKFRIQTTDSNHAGPFADRIVKFEEENHMPTRPGEVLAGDITYLRIGDSFVYLAVVMDIFTREIVGWSLGDSLKAELVVNALDAAMYITSPDARIIFHSDRGSQYASDAFRKFMMCNNIVPSMSRKGNCYDNCFVESWFGGLKKEWIYRREYRSKAELKQSVFEYIEIWYNRRRKHSSLGYVAPQRFKESFLAVQ